VLEYHFSAFLSLHRRFRRQCRARAMLALTASSAPRTAGWPVRAGQPPPCVVSVRAGGKKGKRGGAGGGALSTASSPERVDRLLSRLGYCARSEAKRWVAAGRVTMDGEPVKRADAKVVANDPRLSIDGEAPDHPNGILALMHKPAGVVCSHDPREGPSVYDLLPARWRGRNPRMETVGRLDKDTTGLLLLTDDGRLNHRLTSPKKHVPKTYEVCVDADFPPDAPAVFASGTLTLSGEAKPCLPATLRVDEASRRHATLTLVEGKYHQVKRMCESAGCVVTSLHRRSFGGMTLEGAAEPGQIRVVTKEELDRSIGDGEEGGRGDGG
jgi:16S rRNA pseudouridine516 synthase